MSQNWWSKHTNWIIPVRVNNILRIHFVFSINVIASTEGASSLSSKPFTVTTDPPVSVGGPDIVKPDLSLCLLNKIQLWE